jgi:hypothetical protein
VRHRNQRLSLFHLNRWCWPGNRIRHERNARRLFLQPWRTRIWRRTHLRGRRRWRRWAHGGSWKGRRWRDELRHLVMRFCVRARRFRCKPRRQGNANGLLFGFVWVGH